MTRALPYHTWEWRYGHWVCTACGLVAEHREADREPCRECGKRVGPLCPECAEGGESP